MNKLGMLIIVILAVCNLQSAYTDVVYDSNGTYAEHTLGVGSLTNGTFNPSTSGILEIFSTSFQVKGSGTIQLTI